jgi:adenylate kinase
MEGMANLVLLGPPGSGKGTQAARLTQAYGIPAIATGDILRAQADGATPLGQRVRRLLDSGELVPDSLVIDIIRHRLSDPDTQAGFILDGFPRTVPQAQALDAMLADLQRPLDAAAYLQVDAPALLDRLGQRHRRDDTPEVAAHRIDVFSEQTAPLIDYYRRQSKLRLIDGSQPPEGVAAAIDGVVRPLLRAGGGPSRSPGRR